MSLPDRPGSELWPDDVEPSAIPLGPDPVPSRAGAVEVGWLEEILLPLGSGAGECWMALEALATVEPLVRGAIIAELSSRRAEPGVGTLLRLLSAALDPTLRAAARLALDEPGTASIAGTGLVATGPRMPGPGPRVPLGGSAEIPAVVDPGESRASSLERRGIRLARSLVTPLDGQGRGSVVVSISQAGQRRTAAFWCDVLDGILDVVGEVEPDSPAAGHLVDEIRQQTGADSAVDAPELALGLLGGSLSLSGPTIPGPVAEWLDGTLGPGFQAPALPVIIPEWQAATLPDAELSRCAEEVLDACPCWEDDSPLTRELAREIQFREGRAAADPVRDAGAYRFLFEHLLVFHLERYRRMLMWMAWLWQSRRRKDLAHSACVLASQLADDQYAVPSHPFTAALTTRSLEAARARLRTGEDPRRCGRTSPAPWPP
jgi:hypothetical protein